MPNVEKTPLEAALDKLVEGPHKRYDETDADFRERVREGLDAAFERAERVLEIERLRDAIVKCPAAVEVDNRALAAQLHECGVRARKPEEPRKKTEPEDDGGDW